MSSFFCFLAIAEFINAFAVNKGQESKAVTIYYNGTGAEWDSEIEKANNEIIDLFLSMLDQGFFESSKGERIDCTSCMMIFISNYGYNAETTFKRNITGYVSKNMMISKILMQICLRQSLRRPRLI